MPTLGAFAIRRLPSTFWFLVCDVPSVTVVNWKL